MTLVLYYSALDNPEANLLVTDPYAGRGCKDKGGDPNTIGGVAPKGGDMVLCADGKFAQLKSNLRCVTFEYVRFIGEPPKNHPFYRIPNCSAMGISTKNYYRPVFETDRHPLRIEWKDGGWHEITPEVADDD